MLVCVANTMYVMLEQRDDLSVTSAVKVSAPLLLSMLKAGLNLQVVP